MINVTSPEGCMSTWGVDTFDKGTACDFAAQVVEGSGVPGIEAALDKILKAGSGYLEAPGAEERLAASDIVARLRGNFGVPNPYTEQVDNWVRQCRIVPTSALIQEAKQPTIRVLTEPPGLLELSNESEEAKARRAVVEGLNAGL
jgi:hypothetical protein